MSPGVTVPFGMTLSVCSGSTPDRNPGERGGPGREIRVASRQREAIVSDVEDDPDSGPRVGVDLSVRVISSDNYRWRSDKRLGKAHCPDLPVSRGAFNRKEARGHPAGVDKYVGIAACADLDRKEGEIAGSSTYVRVSRSEVE